MPDGQERLTGPAHRGLTPRSSRRRARRSRPFKIVHVEGLARGVVLHLDRMVLAEELEPALFPPARFPEGVPRGVTLVEWQGRNDQWHLAGLTAEIAPRMPKEIVRAILVGPSLPTPEQSRRNREADKRWENTYDPVLGMTPAQAIRHPGVYERNGHFIWIGSDPQVGLCIQRYDIRNASKHLIADVRYYMEQGLSLREALVEMKAQDWQNLQMAALALSGLRSGGGFVRVPRLPGLRTPRMLRSRIATGAEVGVRENLVAAAGAAGELILGAVLDHDDSDPAEAELRSDVAAVEALIDRHFDRAR